MFFSAPPLRTKIGNDTPKFVRVATPAGPDTAPNGEPIVLYRTRGSTGGLYSPGSYAMDASGQWWASFGDAPIKITPSSGSILDTITTAVTNYIIPALAGIIGASVGGPAGFAAAMALTTWAKLAKGASISDAVNETLKQTPGIIDHSVIKNTYESILKNGFSPKQIDDLRKLMPKDEDTQKAFDTGVALAKAQQTQAVLIEDIEDHLPSDRQAGFKAAVANGGLIKDYIGLNFGTTGMSQLNVMADSAAAKVQSGAAASPSAGGSSGPGVGTVVVVGAAGYGLYKLWPKIMGHFSRPGQPARKR